MKYHLDSISRNLRICPLMLALIAGISAPAQAALYDDFNDNSINASLWNIANVGSGVSVAETNQRLEIGLAADAADDPVLGFFGGVLSSKTVFHGDLDVTVGFQLLDWPTPSNGAMAGLGFHDSSNTSNYWGVSRLSTGKNQPFAAEYYATYDNVSGVTAWSDPTTDQSGTLRLTRVGTTLSGYYFSGGQWQLLSSNPITSADLIFTVNLVSNTPAFGDQAVKVAFDNVNVVPVPAAVWLFASGLLGLVGIARRRKKPM